MTPLSLCVGDLDRVGGEIAIIFEGPVSASIAIYRSLTFEIWISRFKLTVLLYRRRTISHGTRLVLY